MIRKRRAREGQNDLNRDDAREQPARDRRDRRQPARPAPAILEPAQMNSTASIA